MRAWLVGLSLIGLSATAAVSCVVAPFDPPTVTGNGGSDGSGSTTTSAGGGNQGPGGSGGAGGAGGAASSSSTSDVASSNTAASSSSTGGNACVSDEDCANFKVPICHKASCSGGVCVKTPISSPDEQKPDAIGDCKSYSCENGMLKSSLANNDVPIDTNPCTNDVCTQIIDLPDTCPLPSGGGGLCIQLNGKPTCVQCTLGLTCGIANVCAPSGQCISSICQNNMKDGDETGTDCGGSCLPCKNGLSCGADMDCQSKNCSGSVCMQGNCGNGKQDGEESDIDCGGFCPNKCPVKATCRVNMDCQSGRCYSGQCQLATCADNVQNGDETGVDCGGSCPHSCE